MKTILYQIHLDEPVLVTALDGDPNSGVSFAYIPGSVLRGVIIGAYMRQRKLKALDAGDPAIRRLFFNGQTQFLNGYPECEDGRSLPAPRAWHSEKGRDDNEVGDFTNVSPLPDQQWKTQKSPFFAVYESELHFLKPEQRLSVHNQRDRVMGRPTAAEGAVYRYIALLPGQTFQAAVVCFDEEIESQIKPLIAGQVKLGGARTGGYGLATFKQLPCPVNWVEISEPTEERPDELVITLLSDALIRDEHGQFSAAPEAIAAEISRELGNCPLAYKTERGIPKAFIDTRLTGGFNRKWGMPLPQSLAVKMGSVLIFQRPACSPDLLDKLANHGIGERLEDGFGRVAVNWPDTQPYRTIRAQLPQKSSGAIDLPENSAGRRLAVEILQRMVETQLAAAITQRAYGLADKIKKPKRSQLSRLIEFLQNALKESPETGRANLDTYLNTLEARRATRDQFTQDIVDGKSLLDWIRSHVWDQQKIWEELIQNKELPHIGGVTFDQTGPLAYHYNLRLVIATLAYATKAEKE